jgi:TDG/mug DNA glycosylase family protein
MLMGDPEKTRVDSVVLPDVLTPGLKVVFCGMAAGLKSAEAGAYFAGPGNSFWTTLHKIGLTDRELVPREYTQVTRYGIGLTDLVKWQAGMDKNIKVISEDVDGLRRRIQQYAPEVLAFNGKKAAKMFFGRRRVEYGRQPETIGSTLIFVLPSTSAAARRYWDVRYWQELERAVFG